MKKEKQWKILLVALLFAVTAYFYRGLETSVNAIEWYANYTNFTINTATSHMESLRPFVDEDKASLKLYALSACLMDASTGRVLYEKDGYNKMSMASTTKIMTLIVVLENANLDDIVTVSSNAAVAIAEHVGGSVENFCNMMTAKAKSIGAKNTQFKTPNGLDAEGHFTTAADLALIGSYAIKNKDFRDIVATTSYSFKEITKNRNFNVTNKDRFLYMMDGAIGIKTGFTGKAGYCFVGAIDIEGRTFVSVVLGSGWPPNKSYKWADTQKLMKYGLDNYTVHRLLDDLHIQQPDFEVPSKIAISNGRQTEGTLYMKENIKNEELLLKEGDMVQAKANIKAYVEAPVLKDTIVGSIEYYVNDTLYREVPVYVKEEVKKINFPFVLSEVFKLFFN